MLAIHTNMPATVPADVDKALLAGAPAPAGLSAEERLAYAQLERTFKQVDYARLMASRPQTLYGIADSPVGLAAWLLDHNDADGQPAATVAAALKRTSSATGELTRDEILDNITLYWLTNTGVSASRLYWEYKGSVLVTIKTVVLFGLARLFGHDHDTALRTGLTLAQGGEFGFVLFSAAASAGVMTPDHANLLVAVGDAFHGADAAVVRFGQILLCGDRGRPEPEEDFSDARGACWSSASGASGSLRRRCAWGGACG